MLLLRNGDLYAPEARGRHDLLVAGSRIVWLGPKAPALPKDLAVTEVDLEGRRVIPGLVDCHAHLTGGGGEAGYHTRVPPVPLSRFARGGTTTAIGLLGTDDCTRTTSALIATAKGLCHEGLTALCYTGGYHLPPTTLTGTVKGDIVHVAEIVGAGEIALSDHRSSQPTFDELVRLASEAHVAGMMTGKAGLVHLHLGDGKRGLQLVARALAETELPARVFHPTHVNRKKALFEEACALVAKHEGFTIDVTAFPVDEGEDAWSAPDAVFQFLKKGLPKDRITVSSDGGGCLPKFDAQGQIVAFGVGDPADLGNALHELLARGASLVDVLPAFTSNVARLFRLADKGRIAVGCDADLVVLDQEHRVRDVLARGRFLVRDAAVVVWGSFERP